jgi:cytochrome P450/NADPH-cytochrome P450 reductase
VRDIGDDLNRLTFDTISLAAFGERSNSLHSPEPVPFVTLLNQLMADVSYRTRTPSALLALNVLANRRWRLNLAQLRGIMDDIITRRKAGDQTRIQASTQQGAHGSIAHEALLDCLREGNIQGHLRFASAIGGAEKGDLHLGDCVIGAVF